MQVVQVRQGAHQVFITDEPPTNAAVTSVEVAALNGGRGPIAASEERLSDYELAAAINRMKCIERPFIQDRDQELLDYLGHETHCKRLDCLGLERVVGLFIADYGRFGIYPTLPVVECILEVLRASKQRH